MYDNKKVIKFNEVDEVKEFVNDASSCDFDIDVQCRRAVIDAKSMLGMLALGLNLDVTVCYGGENQNFEKMVKRLAVAY